MSGCTISAVPRPGIGSSFLWLLRNRKRITSFSAFGINEHCHILKRMRTLPSASPTYNDDDILSNAYAPGGVNQVNPSQEPVQVEKSVHTRPFQENNVFIQQLSNPGLNSLNSLNPFNGVYKKQARLLTPTFSSIQPCALYRQFQQLQKFQQLK